MKRKTATVSGGGRALRARPRAMDMWTMRLRAPLQPVDNAGALPTARSFDHMPTARYDNE